MTILDLQKTLKNQIAKQGRAIISEATIKEAGLTPQVGFDKTLTDYLLLQTDLYITNIPDVPDPQSNTLTIEGKGAFFTSSDDKYKLLIKLAKFDLKVTFQNKFISLNFYLHSLFLFFIFIYIIRFVHQTGYKEYMH